MENAKRKSERIYWVDAAKAIGIFLVFYGHVVEFVQQQESLIAFSQFKFIFSFHMPFFFFVAGFFFKRRYQSMKKEIVTLFYTRLIPVLLFGITAIPFWMAYQYLKYSDIRYMILLKDSLHYLHGETKLNGVTWFLVCLLATEVLALVLLSKTTKSYQKALLAIISLSLGMVLTNKINLFEPYLGFHKNTWYFHEAIVSLGFYALGHLSFPHLHKLTKIKAVPRLALTALFIALTALTFDLNTPYAEFVVVMKESWHGSSIYFIMTAIFGILSVILLSTFIPKSPAVNFIGQNTLILLGINGFFLHFVNPYLATLLNHLDSAIWVTGYSTLISVVSILVSVPFIFLLNKYLPQLVGRPYQQGPLLPSLDSVTQLHKKGS